MAFKETGEKFYFEVEMTTSTGFHTEIVHGTVTAMADYQLNQVDAYAAKVSVTKIPFTKGKNHYKEIY